MRTFADLDLLPTLTESLAEQGITTPTEIQSLSVPALLAGRPVLAVAETGSGKTLAYVLPMLHRLKTMELQKDPIRKPSRPRGLVVVPGRELGEQITKVFKTLTHATRLRVRSAIGGTKKQIARQNVGGIFEILVATPGRLEALLDAGELLLEDLRMVVFDEVDQLVEGRFLDIVQRALAMCPAEVQRATFSATLSGFHEVPVRDLFVEPPQKHYTKGSRKLVPTLQTDNRRVGARRRFEVLAELARSGRGTGTILFANTREQVDRIAQFLAEERIPCETFRGQMDRTERRAALGRFRRGEIDLLLTTDLGGRGLDIDRVERVVNVHLPKDIDNYMHRVGRTARAGRSGLVVNLITHRDEPLIAKLKKRAAK